MPLMEVVVQSVYYNQLIINRFNYVATGTPAGSTLSLLLLRAMGFIPDNGVFPGDTVFAAIRNMQPATVSYRQVLARNVYSETDFWENPYPVPPTGGATAEGLSPAVAYGFRTNRVRYDIGRGYKRFVGVTEGASGPGGVFTSGTLALMATLANRMSVTLNIEDSGNNVSFAPAVVKKERYIVPDTDPVRHAYRYYESEAEQLANTAVGFVWQNYTQSRTQTSRQYGRGE